jgi:hypothetical protein
MRREHLKELIALHCAMAMLMGATSTAKWDDASAKAIGQAQWDGVWKLAIEIDNHVRSLPVPTPGADPLGFIWLTYAAGERKFELELHADLTRKPYRWTITKDGMKSSHQSDKKHELLEALRATFGHTEQSRIILAHHV